jgi:putative hydrolase of the HAD superfamily
MIRLVTFDFWDTLVTDTAENLAAQRRLRVEGLVAALGAAGIVVSPEAAAAGHDGAEALLVERYWGRHRDPSAREQVRLVVDCIAPGAAARLSEAAFERVVQAYISPVLARPPALQSGARDAVQGLAARGVRLAIISNTGRTPGIVLREVLRAHGLLGQFAVVSYSDEVGYRKPDGEIFRRTLAAAGARAAQAAHVGDNPAADVAGARGVGMRGVHFRAPGRAPAPEADLTVTDLAELPRRLLGG